MLLDELTSSLPEEARLDLLARSAELLQAIALASAGEDDLGHILSAALDRLAQLVPFTGGSIALVEGDELVSRAARGPFAGLALGQRLPRGRGLSWQVVEQAQPRLCHDVLAEGRLTQSIDAEKALRSYLAVPLAWRGQVFGLLEIDSTQPHAFRSSDVALLQAVAAVLSGPVELARRLVQEQVAAETLRFQKTLLEAQSEASVDGILVVDPRGRILSLNRRFAELWGIPDSVLASRSDEAALNAVRDKLVDPEKFLARVAYLYQHPEERSRDEIRLKDGRIFDRYSGPVSSTEGVHYGRVWFFRDVTERKRAEEALAFLAEASTVLAGSLDYETTLQTVADLAVPEIADWCLVDIVEADESLLQVGVAHVEASGADLARELRRRYPPEAARSHPIWRVLRTGRAELAAEVSDADLQGRAQDAEHLRLLRELGIRSHIVVPLVARGRIIGAISLIMGVSGRRYGERDLAVAAELARRAAVAIDNARLYREAQEQAAVHVQLNAALREVAEVRDRALGEAEYERERLRYLFLRAPAAIAVLRGPEHVFEFVNPRYVQLVAKRNLLGKPIREVFPELEGQGYFELLDKVYRTAEPFVGTEMLARWVGDDGAAREVLLNFVCEQMRAADGSVDGIFAHVVDVTEQVRSRQRVEQLAAQLAAERARLAAVLEQLPVGVLITDAPSGRIVQGNRRAEEILGHRVLHSDSVDDYGEWTAFHAHGSHVRAEEWPLARAVARGEVVAGEEIEYLRGDGTRTWINLNAAPIRDHSGAIVAGVVTFSDVSARKQAEDERARLVQDLQRELRTRDEFLASASHDLKTPLTAIKGHAQLLQRLAVKLEGPAARRLAARLSSIDASTTRMNRLIDELLDVTRLQMGQQLRLERGPVDLVALARQAVAEHQPGAQRHGLRVEAHLPELVGEWDVARLERVLANLLSNAVKYSPEGGEVVVSVGREERFAVLRVRDHGVGIPARDLPRVFERFYRGANAEGRVSGTGLGLSGVKQIVERHGGQVALESREGSGTSVTVRLPL